MITTRLALAQVEYTKDESLTPSHISHVNDGIIPMEEQMWPHTFLMISVTMF